MWKVLLMGSRWTRCWWTEVLVNLMPYTTFRKLGKGPRDLIETDMMFRDFGGNTSKTRGQWMLNWQLGVRLCSPHSLSSMEKGHTVYSLVMTAFMQTVVCHQPCISVWFNGIEMMLNWFALMSPRASQQTIQSLGTRRFRMFFWQVMGRRLP